QEAREFIARNGLADKIQVGLGDATAMQFEAGGFDRLIALECAFHFRTRQDFFPEAARVLAPGGGLGMTAAIPPPGTDLPEYLRRVHLPVGSDGRYDVPENVYDADTYTAHLRAAGFDQVHVESITERSLPHFVQHVERVAETLDEERKGLFLKAAQCYRD